MRKALVEQPSGFYPYFDSVYSGGGFTLGAGYRHFTGDRTHWNVAGLYSAKGYKLIEASVMSPGHWSGRLDLRATASWRDATQVAYHGLGIDSPPTSTPAFACSRRYVGGDVTVRPHRWVLLTAGAAYEDYTLKDPTGDPHPGRGRLHARDRARASASIPPTCTRRPRRRSTGGRPPTTRGAADSTRSRAITTPIGTAPTASTGSTPKLVQHIPILRENWVISLRGRLETTLDDDDQVPYFLLPSLGSGSTLRGYSSWRFRDRHAVLLSGEWRWIPNRMALDMAFFYDTGMVAPRLDAIALGSFVSDFGVGVRFHAPAQTPLRIELAKGSEGMQLVFAASAAF